MKNIVFDSKTEKNGALFQIASGYDSETRILFEKEGVIVKIRAEGQVDFYDAAEQLLASAKMPSQEGGREVYQDVGCGVEGTSVILRFPIYQWIDNYPHCDGEHDRWDTRTVGYHTVTFDLSSHSVAFS